jgi:hypothetical protein
VSYDIIQNWLESLFVFLDQSKQLSPQVAADREAMDQNWTLARVDIQELQQIVSHNLQNISLEPISFYIIKKFLPDCPLLARAVATA